jgi:hypothetical protein
MNTMSTGIIMVGKSNAVRQPWSPREVRYLRRFYGRRPLEEIAVTLDRPVRRVFLAARALGLDKRDERERNN